MKKVFKITGYTLLVIVLIVIGLISYVKVALPDVGAATEIKVASTPEQIERGRYLANSVNGCVDCHSTRDWSLYAGPYKAGTEGQGGDRFGKEAGFPGDFYARNITPYHLKDWTDGEIFRTITTGVDKDGKILSPSTCAKNSEDNENNG